MSWVCSCGSAEVNLVTFCWYSYYCHVIADLSFAEHKTKALMVNNIETVPKAAVIILDEEKSVKLSSYRRTVT